MLSVVIPTLNAEPTLARTLAALIPAVLKGVVREVIVADGGSTDATLEIVEAAGARLVQSSRGRGIQLAAGAQGVRCDWLLFLEPDTVLQTGWEAEVEKLIEHAQAGRFGRGEIAATFRFALDDFSFSARVMEKLVALRCLLLRLPYGNQGLLVSKRLYDRVGGFRALPHLEDVDLARRILRQAGRSRFVLLRAKAVTVPESGARDGFFAGLARNMLCLSLYYLRVPPRFIPRLSR